ncbi:MAG: hypothetical protein K2L54_04865, partial [Clostridiales bacterium]|nr:hypothetical protein [Clostridiales bacterium]
KQPSKPKKKKKQRYSGDYYYIDTDEKKLAEQAFIRTALTVIAFMLQVVVLLMPQGGLEYVTNKIPSYAYAYMWIVFVMLGASIWIVIMNMTRYKFRKRIPKENAPRNGFKYRAFFGAELYIIVNAVMLILELSFVCIHYDGVGLGAFFVCAAALGCAIAARQVTHIALKNAELISAPTENSDKQDEETKAATDK